MKACLVVLRNQVRDYLDVVALANVVDDVPAVLAGIYDYDSVRAGSALTAPIQRRSEPDPRDLELTRELGASERLAERWHR